MCLMDCFDQVFFVFFFKAKTEKIWIAFWVAMICRLSGNLHMLSSSDWLVFMVLVIFNGQGVGIVIQSWSG